MVTPTAAQKKIRDHEGLALLVVAPAGCGKTEALALRVAGLVDQGAVAHPRRVLVTTFSNRARDNVRDRLRSYLPVAVMRDRVTISNFHGFSARVFRAHARVIGMDPEMTIPESDWVREQCQSRGLSFNDTGLVQDILRVAKQQTADDAAVEQFLIRQGNDIALEIEQQRIAQNRLTYDDLPRLAELILANDSVADLYRNHFAAVVVDEFQDLTPQQLRIANRIGNGRTTYAGDLAQGIYGFAGAQPQEVDHKIREECPDVIEFAESHRSSPAVLRMVNALSGLTGGQNLTCALPKSWPDGGLAGGIQFASVTDEADWAVNFARTVLSRAPKQRIGIISRTAPRRRFVDAMAEASGLPVYRWDDGVLDTETARVIKAMLVQLTISDVRDAADPLVFLRQAAGLERIPDPDTRRNVTDALSWCLARIHQGLTSQEIRARIRVGDESTLLSAPGVHLLSGHVGKGQQFEWVLVIGAEDGVIPDFRAKSHGARLEEARILGVMISRARHGVVVTYARQVPAANGRIWDRQETPYFAQLQAANFADYNGIASFHEQADWDAIAGR